jgi:hypothetical protein
VNTWNARSIPAFTVMLLRTGAVVGCSMVSVIVSSSLMAWVGGVRGVGVVRPRA